MARAKTVADAEGRFCGIRFDCPACNCGILLPVSWLPEGQTQSPHYVKGPHWGFNGDLDRPTFTPSINSVHTTSKAKHVCHSFITDGRIQFLGDCTHALAGQTVDLPEVDTE